ncbi:hypothetical protein B0H63DRAFT_520456 [Podospora didyma]|uniref:Uncharacterized protein n=1 Tax=Podospora didyma TaxID=330526 RepID=A0AAE0P0Q6_9PEZI|nr:hypothetical protein B0H63DRAFT_520456 [Podospora didyma]
MVTEMLWAHIRAGMSLNDLRDELEQVPPEVEWIYEKILLFASHCRGGLPVMYVSWLDHWDDTNRPAPKQAKEPYSIQEIATKVFAAQKRLELLTRGMLVCKPRNYKPGVSKTQYIFRKPFVDFSHRTVRTFAATGDLFKEARSKYPDITNGQLFKRLYRLRSLPMDERLAREEVLIMRRLTAEQRKSMIAYYAAWAKETENRRKQFAEIRAAEKKTLAVMGGVEKIDPVDPSESRNNTNLDYIEVDRRPALSLDTKINSPAAKNTARAANPKAPTRSPQNTTLQPKPSSQSVPSTAWSASLGTPTWSPQNTATQQKTSFQSVPIMPRSARTKTPTRSPQNAPIKQNTSSKAWPTMPRSDASRTTFQAKATPTATTRKTTGP